ncbi:MAG TPA: hemerythrin domain-containing protein, partial [Thermoanaerobaculia bacterium]
IDQPWERETMSSLVAFIVDKHHAYTREALATLPPLAAKVRDRHGARHDELRQVEKRVHQLAIDLTPHMLKEEQVLFPYVMALEEAVRRGKEPPIPFFGTAKNPVRMMMAEHEAAGEILVEIRTLTTDFTLPPEACVSFQALYAGLLDIESDLHRHIHLENNILFPRLIAVEENDGKTFGAAVGDHCCAHS